jgi:hypothetical protein
MANDMLVSVGADIRQFESEMKAVAQEARAAADHVEREFNKVSPGANLLVGAIKGAIAAISFERILSGLAAANREIASFAQTAKQTGIDLQTFQQLRIAGQQQGLSGQTVDTGLQALTEKLNEATRQETTLGKLFADNNIALKERTGEVISTNSALERAADLIANAASESDKIKIAEALGLTREWVPLLEKGGAALRNARAEAQQTGNVLDAEIVQRARDFDEAWTRTWANWVQSGKAAIVSVGTTLSQLVRNARAAFEYLDKGTKSDGALSPEARQFAADKGLDGGNGNQPFDAGRFRLDAGKGQLTAAQRASAARQLGFSGAGTTNTDSLYNAGKGGGGRGGGGGGGPSDEDKRFEDVQRYLEALERQSRVLEAERATLGQSNAERAKAIELARIGTVVDEGQKARLDEIVGRNVALREEIDRVRQAQQGLNDAAQLFGGFMIEGFTAAAKGGDALKNTLQNIGQQLIRASFQAAILGSGPLAGVFGTGAKSGETGGLVGLALGALKGFGFGGTRAGGGGVSAGMAYKVGEDGPEYFIPTQTGYIVPNRSGALAAPASGAGGAGRTTVQIIQNISASSEHVIMRAAQVGAMNAAAAVAARSGAQAIDQARRA